MTLKNNLKVYDRNWLPGATEENHAKPRSEYPHPTETWIWECRM